MKVVIPGGVGQVGQILKRYFEKQGDEVVVLSRKSDASNPNHSWDGKSLGSWVEEIDGSDVVINLAGRSVNCRYTQQNMNDMMDSRVESTRIVGQAIGSVTRPPKVWLQMSTATIYAHRFDAPNDEHQGQIGGQEPDVPRYWDYSVKIAQAWEHELHTAEVPGVRKVALRTAMVMSSDKEGIFDVLCGMTRKGLGGPIAGGKQYVSWIHSIDFCHAVQFLINRDHIEGAVNLTSPNPLPQREFMKVLREAANIKIGLPAAAWMAKVGALFMGTDTELILKSRRVVPTRLLNEGFSFQYPQWPDAVQDLLKT